MSDSNVFSPDFKEFIELLNQHKAEYLITDGYAVGIYGHPRYTGDIDIWINSSEKNANKLVKVFNDFGLESINISISDFTEPEQVIQIGYPPFRIDILTTIDGVNFSEAYPNKNTLEIDDLSVHFISLEDLKKNKLASGRGQDLEDLRNLKDE